ncbi:MAG: hypothetical protein OSJ27_07315 [Candidatus Gastranaerophilales bacterium]|nr:hypothetical protein [Candidatus Gastranaerophilales bacterium]
MYLKDFYLFKMDVEALKTPFQTILNKESWIEMRLSAKAIEAGEKHIPKEIIQIAYPKSKRFNEYERVLKYEQKIQLERDAHIYLHNSTRSKIAFDALFVLGLIVIIALIFALKKYKGFIEKLKTNLKEANQTKTETPKTKICPHCSEEILYTAKKCRYCQSNLYQFTFLKNPKFNFTIWCSLLTLVVVLVLLLICRYFYPICLYAIFLFKSILDPVIIIILVFTLGFSAKKSLWNTFLAIIIILSIYGCINGYREYVANVFSISRIATMLIFALVVLVYICQKLQKKCSTTIGLLCLWIGISLIIKCTAVDTTIPAELDTTDNSNYIKVAEYNEDNLDLPEYAWKTIAYTNEKWHFEEFDDSAASDLAICGIKGCHDVKNFAEAQEATWYTQEEIDFILNHDMLDEKNENEFNVKFRGGTTLELPTYKAFGRLYISHPNYMTIPNLIGIDKKLAVVYSYNSSCDLTNCAWLNIEILKADEDGKIKNIFQKNYNQNNNGSYEIIPYHNSHGDNLTIKIEGKNKLIVLMYSEYDKKIREYIFEPKPSESLK